jgi:carbamoyl-phosphate synthase small subunit
LTITFANNIMGLYNKRKATLLLQDGTVFEGYAIGAIGTTTGEICFNTGMSGYQEIFTDPSYYGQIVTMANAHIGNYGVQAEEIESKSVKIAGMVCKNFNEGYSRKLATGSLQAYFEAQNVVGISNVDTRALIRYIRNKGVMNAIISSEDVSVEELKERLAKVPSMEGLELSSKVSTPEFFELGNKTAKHRVALLDFGVKHNILRSLGSRDCFVGVFPVKSKLEDVLKWQPDGFMLSNGPGDPSVMKEEIALVKSIIEVGKPVFGICLGHQLLAESQGIKTKKMHNGHRGINHPVQNIISGKSEITSQNHGFTVIREDIDKNANVEVTHVNLNDQTIEGIRLKGKKVFSVQYHPEANPGPWDSRYLFDEFVANMEK